MDNFSHLLWEQFKAVKEQYLGLREEKRRMEQERQKVVERLDLLRKLLALEGKKVDLPENLVTDKKRRAA